MLTQACLLAGLANVVPRSLDGEKIPIVSMAWKMFFFRPHSGRMCPSRPHPLQTASLYLQSGFLCPVLPKAQHL